MKKLNEVINNFNNDLMDVLKDNHNYWTIGEDYYESVIYQYKVRVTPNVIVISKNDSEEYIIINTEMYGYLSSQYRVIYLNDIIVKVTHKEMKSLDIDIEPVDAYIVIDGNSKKFKLYYNTDDDIYFGYARDFEIDGIPYCRLYTYKEYMNRDYEDLSPRSLLRSYGYQLTDTTPEYRHKVLKFVIDNDIMGWKEIINFIEWLISLRKGQKCVILYEQDIDWIRDYVKKNKNKIIVK
jgi:hypothetical protein